MKRLIKESVQEHFAIKSIKEIMKNVYKIAEASGFYTPINKAECIDK